MHEELNTQRRLKSEGFGAECQIFIYLFHLFCYLEKVYELNETIKAKKTKSKSVEKTIAQ